MGNLPVAAQSRPPVIQTPPPVCLEVPEIENPGPLEEIHQKCKNVFPFEEPRLNLTRGLSSYLQISHTINQGSIAPSLYSLGLRVGTEQISPTKPSLFHFDVDQSGNLNATLFHQLTPNLQGKFGIQVQNSKCTVRKCTLTYKGSNYTVSTTVVDPLSSLSESKPSSVVLNYLKSITSNFTIGTGVSYMKGDQFIALNAAAKLHNEHSAMSFTLDETGTCHLCYYQKASKHLDIGIVFDLNTCNRHSFITFGYKVDIPTCDLIFKGHIDCNWSVGAVLEKKLLLHRLPVTLAFGGLMNHTKNQYHVGFGIIIG